MAKLTQAELANLPEMTAIYRALPLIDKAPVKCTVMRSNTKRSEEFDYFLSEPEAVEHVRYLRLLRQLEGTK